MAEESNYTESNGGFAEGRGSSRSRSSSGSGPRRGRGGRRYQGRPKVCLFCAEKGQRVDYKQADLLRRFINESGKIRPRRQTGTCARHQRLLAVAIKRARHLALIPFVGVSSR